MFIDKDKNFISVGSWEYEGMKHSPNIFSLWSDEELSAVGIYRVTFEEIPEGKQATGWEYELNEHNATATPILEDIPIYVPESVTKAQGKAALVQKGYYNSVLSFLEGLDEPDKSLAQIAFNDTNEWQRDSHFLGMAASELSLSSEDLDELFILAESIRL